MRQSLILEEKKAQTAVEYILLLMTVVVIVLLGFRTYLPRIYESSEIYFNRAATGILGEAPRCGDGCCGTKLENGDCGDCYFSETSVSCPVDCNLTHIPGCSGVGACAPCG